MKVTLLHHTPLWVADKAIGKCWDKSTPDELCIDAETGDYSYIYNPLTDEDEIRIVPGCNTERIERVANKRKHSSTIEHLTYNFDIDGVSRALLQELARHRMASLSVKSTRYTLKELKEISLLNRYQEFDRDVMSKFVVFTSDTKVNTAIARSLIDLQECLQDGISNDIAKYCLPEAYKTSLIWTINARSLQNFLSLRTDKSALWEIRELAQRVFEALPEDHKFLFKEFVKC